MKLTQFHSFAIILTSSALIYGEVHHSGIWKSDILWKGQILEKYVLGTFHNTSKVKCAVVCDSKSDCLMFFYTKSSGSCRLISDEFLHIKPEDAKKHLHSSLGTKLYFNTNKNPFLQQTATVKPLSSQISSLSTLAHAKSSFGPVCAGFDYAPAVNKYYTYVSKDTADVKSAQRHCIHQGGHLATPKEKPALKALGIILDRLISRDGQDRSNIAFWVAAKFSKDAGTFIWLDDNSTIQTSNNSNSVWNVGQPEKRTGSTATLTDCVFIIPSYGYGLDDFFCPSGDFTGFFPLCECQ